MSVGYFAGNGGRGILTEADVLEVEFVYRPRRPWLRFDRQNQDQKAQHRLYHPDLSSLS